MSSGTVMASIKDPNYFHREFKNDIGMTEKEHSWVAYGQRVALVALPFISQYRPLGFIITSTMGTARIWTCSSQLIESIKQGKALEASQNTIQTTIAVLSLAGTIFAHPVGMILTTSQDLILEVANLNQYLREGEYQKATESCLKIINNSLYLGTFLHGGVELAIVSLATQILLGIYQSQAEFKQGRYLEGSGHLVMTMVHGTQLAGQVKTLQIKLGMEKLVREVNAKQNGNIEALDEREERVTLALKNSNSEEVFEIYLENKRYTLEEIIQKNRFKEALLLLKHHLYRPDENGICCKWAVAKGAPLELIKMCLPDRQFLTNNPVYLDDLFKKAWLQYNTQPEILSFFSDRDALKNCPERDQYFKDWFSYEIMTFGAKEGEWFEDFIKRKQMSAAEKTFLIEKLPIEIRRMFGHKGHYQWELKFDHFLMPNTSNHEHALISLKYLLYKPTYHKNFSEKNQNSWGSFERLLYGYPLTGERGNFLFMELFKRLIPSEQDITNDSAARNNLFNFWVSRVIAIGQQWNIDSNIKAAQLALARELLEFLTSRGVDLNKVAETTTYQWVKDFLKKQNL